MSGDWPLWEVFIRAKGGLSHRHVDSVHAPDPELALRHARDTYTRRLEGVSLWVVPSAEIVASDPDPARDTADELVVAGAGQAAGERGGMSHAHRFVGTRPSHHWE